MWVASRRWYTPTATLDPKSDGFRDGFVRRCLSVSRDGFCSIFLASYGIEVWSFQQFDRFEPVGLQLSYTKMSDFSVLKTKGKRS